MSGPNSARHSVRGSSDLAFRATFRPDVRDFLIRGSQKVIVHYERLLSTAKSEEERQLYQSRIEREQRVIDDLRKGALPERFAAWSLSELPRKKCAWPLELAHVSSSSFLDRDCGVSSARPGSAQDAGPEVFDPTETPVLPSFVSILLLGGLGYEDT